MHIINLSLGVPLRAETLRRVFGAEPSDASPSLEDAVEAVDWRTLYHPVLSDLATAVREAKASGAIVIAAAGNSQGYVFSPAAVPGVVAVGFHTVQRGLSARGRVDEAFSTRPSYSQALGTDILIVQPAGFVGSSFSCPLIAGFTALMARREDLPSYVRTLRRAAYASELMTLLDSGPTSDEIARIDSLFRGAFDALPHRHPVGHESCPECGFFAIPLYVDFGLFRLNCGDLDAAEGLLASARALDPNNPHAAANLALVYACRARRAKDTGNIPATMEHLEAAAKQMSQAIALRPGHAPFRSRFAEFAAAQLDPITWTLAP